jgi:hypothetical protein
MSNLALGLAQLAIWVLMSTPFDRWIVSLVGFDLRYLGILAMIILVWGALLLLFKRKRVAVVTGPMYFLLALANVLTLLIFLVHAYNANQQINHGGGMLSVEEIMAPRFSVTVERYLLVAYPLAHFLLMVSTIALVVPLVRSFRRSGPDAREVSKEHKV